MNRFGKRNFLASSTVSVERSRQTVSVRRITILASASEPTLGQNYLSGTLSTIHSDMRNYLYLTSAYEPTVRRKCLTVPFRSEELHTLLLLVSLLLAGAVRGTVSPNHSSKRNFFYLLQLSAML